jgi:hypothetical protein
LAVADYFYRPVGDKDQSPIPIPRALQIGMDWMKFHVAPCAGGMRDQPLHLLREIRQALAVYQTLETWKAVGRMSADRYSAFCSAHPEVLVFMQELWAAQEEREAKKKELS